MTDEEIIQGCIKNNPKAQEFLYNKYSKKMLGVCMRYATDADEADDMLQLGFINVFKYVSSYSFNGSLEGWVRKVVVNAALSLIRKNKKLKHNVEFDSVDFMIQASSQASDQIQTKDLLKIIQTLPTGAKTIFNLFAIEGYSHAEIGKMLNISEGTSKSQYSRARAYLKKVIKNHQ